MTFESGRGTEVVYWLPTEHVLVAGDVILGNGDGSLCLCPESWLPAGTGHRELRQALRPLLERGADALRALIG